MLEKASTTFCFLTVFWCSLVLEQFATARRGAAVIWEEDTLRADGGQLWYFRKRSEPQCSDTDSVFPKLQWFPDLKGGFRLNSSDFAFLRTQSLVFAACVDLVGILRGEHIERVFSAAVLFLLLPHPLRKLLLILKDLTSISECETEVEGVRIGDYKQSSLLFLSPLRQNNGIFHLCFFRRLRFRTSWFW